MRLLHFEELVKKQLGGGIKAEQCPQSYGQRQKVLLSISVSELASLKAESAM